MTYIMRSRAWVIRLLWSDSCSTCRCHLDRAKGLVNKAQTNECHCSLQREAAETTLSHLSAVLSTSKPPPPAIYDRDFSAYPALLEASWFSEPPPVPVETKCHSEGKLCKGRGETTSSFSASAPMPRCSFQVLQYAVCLSERDRSVSGFPIIFGCSLPQCQQTEPSFLSVCRNWWWIMKKGQLSWRIQMFSHTRTSFRVDYTVVESFTTLAVEMEDLQAQCEKKAN